MSALDRVVERIDRGLETSLERLFELLRIKSISTDPEFAPHCKEAAHWLEAQLSNLGFDASVRETQGLPMVVAHFRPDTSSAGAPHVLFYGHYDVQPVDPLDLWQTPPFEPRRVAANGTERVVARGAADDKGQLMTFLEACRAWIEETGSLPLPITILLEGEEESGSKSLAPFLKAHADELRADLALVCDTNMWDAETPAITTRLRGTLLEEVVITGPAFDLHSGLYGGPAHNPIGILSKIVADLHDDGGRVAVPGFYDGVDEVPEDVRAQWDALSFDEQAFLSSIGQTSAAGESGRSVVEKIWARPTCDVNGIVGGYTGEGTKTVIPSRASAKISFRLVGRQDPDAIREALHAFVRDRLPLGCTVEFLAHGGNAAIEFELGSEHLGRAAVALEAEFAKAPVMMGCGGSIPIVGNFRSMLGMDSLLIGFGLDDDRIHSPNEKYNVSSFRHGMRSWARIIGALAGRGGDS